jgi:hypothetical protein
MTGEGKIASVKTSYRYDMEDEAIVRAIASIKSVTGFEIEVNIEAIRALPEEDYEFLRTKLPKQDEKKSTTKPSEGISEKPQKSGE